MRISMESIKRLCRKRRTALSRLLREAGVSRNAFYSLVRKDSVLPKSVQVIARYLGVRVSEIMTEEERETEKLRSIMADTEDVVKTHKGIDPDNVRHTFLLLREKPINRLRRALIRAQKTNI